MITKTDIIKKAYEVGFADVGFTTADPFYKQKELLASRSEEYKWLDNAGIELMKGTDPKVLYPEVKSIVVVIAIYFDKAFPKQLESHFGRVYLDDDRMTKNGLSRKIKALRVYFRENGIDSKVPFDIPQRLAAARAGLGTFGKNCLFYSNKIAYKSSWVVPVPILIDREFDPDESSEGVGCPEWCKNACIIACPTGALQGPRKLDPRKCISYLTYYGEGLTPKDLREPMGTYIYGCDRCQNVCPRNNPWLIKEKPVNEKVEARSSNFDLSKLLHMDKSYFRTKIWPHMFYMSFRDMWRWKMNVARAMGNTMDSKYIPDLIQAFEKEKDERVKCMSAWAIGRIGGIEARKALEKFLDISANNIKEEVIEALERFS